jgi:PAS domain S-box-containing protein
MNRLNDLIRKLDELMERTRGALEHEMASRGEDLTELIDDLMLRKRDIESSISALSKSEAQFRRLFESNLIGIIFADFDGNVTGANDAYLKMLGYTREELENGEIHWSEITPPEYRALDLKAIQDIKAHGLCTPWEKEYVRKDGRLVQAMVGVALLEGSERECIAFILDITNRKQVEEALRLSEERYRFLAESGKVLTSSLDYDKTLQNVARLAVPTIADYCQIYLLDNQGEIRPVAAAHINPAKETILLDVQRRYLPSLNNRANPVVKVIESGQPELIPDMSGEFLKSIARDEEQLRIFEELEPRSGMVVPLVAHGNKIGAITFVSSESARRFGAAELAFAEVVAGRAASAVDNARLYYEAREASRIKDEFLATVSHELRTPLNAILGWLYLLKSRKLDDVTAMEAMDTIERNARSQAQLVEDLLDISRIITGKLRMEVKKVKLRPVINSALDGVRPAADAKAIQIHASFDPDADDVLGDPNRLRQIIWNLLSNAIKFTPEEGRVDVRVEPVITKANAGKPGDDESNSMAWNTREINGNRRASSFVRVTVSDTGEGISPEFLPHVFERFRQADASTTRLHGGLGLGLAIVRHLVEMHGGSVQADSPGEGLGATFSVSLPRVTEDGLKGETESAITDESFTGASSFPFSFSGTPAHPSSESQYGPLSREAGDVQPITEGADPCDNAKVLEGLRLLIVDDEPDTCEMLSAALTQCGAEVKATRSAGEAVEELKRWRPDVLVAEIGMPVEDGYDMIQRIRKLDPEQGSLTPAIALTAYARAEDRERALEAGYQEHIPKPVEPDELVEVIAKLAARDGVGGQ